jgi:hypothetical protein
MNHSQRTIKVNALADTGIAPLVLALNNIDGLFTIDSCQGSKNEPAYVYFKYGSSPKELAIFCSLLAKELNMRIRGSNDYALRVEWNYDFSTNMAVLVTSQDNIPILTKAINSGVNEHHKTSSFGGRSHTEPHNSQAHQSRLPPLKQHGDTQRHAG